MPKKPLKYWATVYVEFRVEGKVSLEKFNKILGSALLQKAIEGACEVTRVEAQAIDLGRSLPADITKPFDARKHEQVYKEAYTHHTSGPTYKE